jgi:hypothetical protein
LRSLRNLTLFFGDFDLCEHGSSHLALFSALTSSSVRWLSLHSCSFHLSTLNACLNKIPDTQLTFFSAKITVFSDDFEATVHSPNDKEVPLRYLPFVWSVRFPQHKDRFCVVDLWS